MNGVVVASMSALSPQMFRNICPVQAKIVVHNLITRNRFFAEITHLLLTTVLTFIAEKLRKKNIFVSHRLKFVLSVYKLSAAALHKNEIVLGLII